MPNQYTNPAKQLLRDWLRDDKTGWLRHTPVEIAELIGISRSSVHNWIDIILSDIYKLAPDAFRRIRQLQSTVTGETIAEIVEDVQTEGYDRAETAFRFGLHEWNVYFVECLLREKSEVTSA